MFQTNRLILMDHGGQGQQTLGQSFAFIFSGLILDLEPHIFYGYRVVKKCLAQMTLLVPFVMQFGRDMIDSIAIRSINHPQFKDYNSQVYLKPKKLAFLFKTLQLVQCFKSRHSNCISNFYRALYLLAFTCKCNVIKVK